MTESVQCRLITNNNLHPLVDDLGAYDQACGEYLFLLPDGFPLPPVFFVKLDDQKKKGLQEAIRTVALRELIVSGSHTYLHLRWLEDQVNGIFVEGLQLGETANAYYYPLDRKAYLYAASLHAFSDLPDKDQKICSHRVKVQCKGQTMIVPILRLP